MTDDLVETLTKITLRSRANKPAVRSDISYAPIVA